MNIKNADLAKKYATAFLNLFIYKIDEKVFLNITDLLNFFENHSDVINSFCVPNVKLDDKNNIIQILLNKFDLPEQFLKLADILIKDNRIFLFESVLKEISLSYQEKSLHMLFNISSADNLNDKDLIFLRNFIEKKSGKKVIESFTIDKNLIAGIRIQSNILLWEYSVCKQLQNLKHLLVKQGK